MFEGKFDMDPTFNSCNEAEQLQAENDQLKAYNRQLVEALGELVELSNAPKSQCKIEHGPHDTFYCLGDEVPKIGPKMIDSEERKAYWDAFKTAKQALQNNNDYYRLNLHTPPTKLAQAEAEVLKEAEKLIQKVGDYYIMDDTICEITSDLEYAIDKMREAKQ